MELRKEADFYNLVDLKDLLDICLDKHENVVDQWKKNYITQIQNQSESVRDVIFRRCDVGNYSFENITFRHKVDFEYANLTEAVFSSCTFYKEASFKNAELVKTKFKNCKLKKGVLIYFDEANLDGCDFGKTNNHFQTFGGDPFASAYNSRNGETLRSLESLTSRIELMSFFNVRNLGKAHFLEGKLEVIKGRSQADYKQ